jgi:hypothetical protein
MREEAPRLGASFSYVALFCEHVQKFLDMAGIGGRVINERVRKRRIAMYVAS